MNTETRFLDIQGVCRRYAIARRTVWRRVSKGLLPPPVYFDGPQSGGRWLVEELERRDAEHLELTAPLADSRDDPRLRAGAEGAGPESSRGGA